MIKHKKTCSKSFRISMEMNRKLIAYAAKKEISEADVVRLALKKFLPTNTPKHTKEREV